MSLVHILRNVSVRELVRALERDGFAIYRRTPGSGRVYQHRDGRITLIHYHRGSDTLPPGTLGQVLRGAQWTEQDVRRLAACPRKDFRFDYRQHSLSPG